MLKYYYFRIYCTVVSISRRYSHVQNTPRCHWHQRVSLNGVNYTAEFKKLVRISPWNRSHTRKYCTLTRQSGAQTGKFSNIQNWGRGGKKSRDSVPLTPPPNWPSILSTLLPDSEEQLLGLLPAQPAACCLSLQDQNSIFPAFFVCKILRLCGNFNTSVNYTVGYKTQGW